MTNELKFEDKKKTVSEILKTRTLPVVVRIYDDVSQHDAEFDIRRSKVSRKTEVLLQRRLKVKYSHIKVLNYYDNKIIQKEKGPEYVLEHDTYVGEEFLIPLKYTGKVKFAHRPGSWRRYATVSQIINELPRYVRLCADTVAVPTNGIGKNAIISADTTLEVVRKFKQANDPTTYLECSDGNSSYIFCEKDRINCTEVDDTRLYHLSDLARFKMLPKVILFQNVPPRDLILMDNELNSAMSTAVEGPLELLGFYDIDILVGWVRDKEDRTFKTLLIPSRFWESLIVQERSVHGTNEKKEYIDRKYPRCQDTGFVETSLYMMSTDQCQVTWLRSPDFYVRTLSGMHMFEVIPTDFPRSSDDESDENYIEIPEEAPPVPERHPIAHDDTPGHEERALEKKSLFGKVHKELLGWFIHNPERDIKHSKQAEKSPEVPKRPHHRQPMRSKSEKTYSYRHIDTERENKCVHASTDNLYSKYYLTPKSSAVCDSNQHRTEKGLNYDYVDHAPETFRNATRNRPLPREPSSPVAKSATIPALSHTGSSIHESPSNSHTETPTVMPRNRPLPREPSSPVAKSATVPALSHTGSSIHESPGNELPRHESPSNSHTETPTVMPRNKDGGNYVSLSMKEAEHLFHGNLTAEDFYKYTVLETTHCFRHCGLGTFADKCSEHRLDGSFFKNFDLNELRKDPFNLTSFNILKVQKMIFDGWRPNN